MGSVEAWARAKGYAITKTRFYEGEELPLPDSFDWLVIVGGTMSVYEEAKYPWLASEKKFIKKAIAADKVVLGICLGAQLISEALGGNVRKNPCKEIGWFPVSLTEETKDSPVFSALPGRFMAFQWHGDTFSIPPGARRLATSEACPNQAFEIGRAIGVQFHPESSEESIERLISRCGGLLTGGPYIQTTEAIRAGYARLGELNHIMMLLLDRMDTEYCSGPTREKLVCVPEVDLKKQDI